MSVFYLDASAWVKYYTAEPGSEWMSRFWQRQPGLACSALGALEVAAALVRRSRQQRAMARRIDHVVADVQDDFQTFHAISVNEGVLAMARQIVMRHGMRGADAVHLGSAIYLRQTLAEAPIVVASDAELLTAAAAEGFDILDPTGNPPLPDITSRPAGRT